MSGVRKFLLPELKGKALSSFRGVETKQLRPLKRGKSSAEDAWQVAEGRREHARFCGCCCWWRLKDESGF